MSGVNPLAQSDDDFMNAGPPPVVEETAEEKAAREEAEAQAAQEQAAAEVAKKLEAGTNGNADDGASGSEDDDDSNPLNDPDDKLTNPTLKEGEDGKAAEADGKSDEGSNDGTEGAGEKEPKEDEAKAKAAEGDKDKDKKDEGADTGFTVPKSFKANGKEIELRSPEEALKLMQMGANFTRKMQELAPHRKVLMMLQDNKIDESRLSFLIDLENKNPEAIKKLIKDAGIDLNEIDLETESNYVAGNNLVGDDEVGFRTVADDLASDPAGKQTIMVINTTWDDVSKEVLWKQPQLMQVMHEQRQSGIYAQITAEIDRQRALGVIPAATPFLEAYKTVGEQIVAEMRKQSEADEGKQNDGVNAEGKPAVAKPEPTPVATRTATLKSDVANSDKVAAASPSRSSNATGTKTVINPLNMADDEFLKQMEGRT